MAAISYFGGKSSNVFIEFINKKIPKKPFANVEKKISYKDYKILNKLN